MTTVHVLTNVETAKPHRASRVERRRLRMSTIARRAGIDPRSAAVIAQRNGRWVRQRDPRGKRDWQHTLCGKNDVVVFVVLPEGGGASNILRTVAMIAIVVIAAFVAPPLAGALFPALLPGLALTAVTAGITVGLTALGSYAVNALIPAPRQDAPGLSTSLDSANASAPTYSLSISAQQNAARLGGAIPEWFGYHRVVPDLAATAWWEWANGRQRLRQTFCLTKGEIDIEKIELGTAALGSFKDVTYAVFGPGQTASLFEAEVYQSPDVSQVELTALNQLLPGDNGVYGPFAATPPGQVTNRIGIDIGFPRGLYLQNTDGTLLPKSVQWRLEAQEIDDAGVGVGAWFPVATETFSSDHTVVNTSTPASGISGQFLGGGYVPEISPGTHKNSGLTVSYIYTLPAAKRYEVRAQRVDAKDTSGVAGHDVTWNGLRGYLGGGTYGDVTVLQVEIGVTSTITARNSRQVAVTGTRKLPVYDPQTQTWSAPTATRSIAWAAAHVIRNENGGGQPDSGFDLDWLAAYADVWAARGDCFDFYASAQQLTWDFLQQILRCGRAVAFPQGSLIRFHRDEPQQTFATGFSRENIVQHTLSIDYRLPSDKSDADGFEVRFFDKRTWSFNTLRKAFEGGDPPVRPASRPLDGCIEYLQAQRELDYYVAEFRNRPISVEFNTEMDGLIPSYGDAVLVAHDSPRWGQSNRVLDWDADTRTIELTSPPVWDFDPDDETGWYVRIRDIKGVFSEQALITASPTRTSIVLNNAPVYKDGSPFDFTLSDTELLHLMLGHATDAPRPARFRQMIPRGNGRLLTVRAVLEDDAVHVN